MKKTLSLAGLLAVLLLCGCSDPWTTNTARNSVEQYLLTTSIERSVDQADFKKYSGKKVFLDYTYLATQADKPYFQGYLEMNLAQTGIVLVPKADGADYIIQPFCAVLANDHNRFFFGTPAIPIPIAYVNITFAVPEIPLFKKYTRYGYGKFAFNILDAKTKKPLQQIRDLRSGAVYTDWTILFIPFRSYDMEIDEKTSGKTHFWFNF